MHAQLDPSDIKRLELKSTHKSVVCVYVLYPLGEVDIIPLTEDRKFATHVRVYSGWHTSILAADEEVAKKILVNDVQYCRPTGVSK